MFCFYLGATVNTYICATSPQLSGWELGLCPHQTRQQSSTASNPAAHQGLGDWLPYARARHVATETSWTGDVQAERVPSGINNSDDRAEGERPDRHL